MDLSFDLLFFIFIAAAGGWALGQILGQLILNWIDRLYKRHHKPEPLPWWDSRNFGGANHA